MLLNKYNFLPRLFVSPKDHPHAATKGVYVDTAKFCTVATDRYSLLMVEAPKHVLAADFPIIEGHEINGDQKQADSHIMPAEAAAQIEKNLKQIKKAALPILNHAAPLKVATENAAGYVTTTLEQSQPVIYRKIDDTFPPYSEVIPKADRDPAAAFTLDPEKLENMAAAFRLAGCNAVKVQFYGNLEPVKFEATGGDSQKITGIIMPIKD